MVHLRLDFRVFYYFNFYPKFLFLGLLDSGNVNNLSIDTRSLLNISNDIRHSPMQPTVIDEEIDREKKNISEKMDKIDRDKKQVNDFFGLVRASIYMGLKGRASA